MPISLELFSKLCRPTLADKRCLQVRAFQLMAHIYTDFTPRVSRYHQGSLTLNIWYSIDQRCVHHKHVKVISVKCFTWSLNSISNSQLILPIWIHILYKYFLYYFNCTIWSPAEHYSDYLDLWETSCQEEENFQVCFPLCSWQVQKGETLFFKILTCRPVD